MGKNSIILDLDVWKELCYHQCEQFYTSGRGKVPGRPFAYTIRGGEMFISTKEKSITKATVMLAYKNALHILQTEGYVAGPKSIGTFGASYLFPIFLALGIITRTPLTLLIPPDKNRGK